MRAIKGMVKECGKNINEVEELLGGKSVYVEKC